MTSWLNPGIRKPAYKVLFPRRLITNTRVDFNTVFAQIEALPLNDLHVLLIPPNEELECRRRRKAKLHPFRPLVLNPTRLF